MPVCIPKWESSNFDFVRSNVSLPSITSYVNMIPAVRKVLYVNILLKSFVCLIWTHPHGHMAMTSPPPFFTKFKILFLSASVVLASESSLVYKARYFWFVVDFTNANASEKLELEVNLFLVIHFLMFWWSFLTFESEFSEVKFSKYASWVMITIRPLPNDAAAIKISLDSSPIAITVALFPNTKAYPGNPSFFRFVMPLRMSFLHSLCSGGYDVMICIDWIIKISYTEFDGKLVVYKCLYVGLFFRCSFLYWNLNVVDPMIKHKNPKIMSCGLIVQRLFKNTL